MTSTPLHALIVLLLLMFSIVSGCIDDDNEDDPSSQNASGPGFPWLQRGHDAQGTFASPDEGPKWPDVALEVPLPGQPQRWTVVLDRQAYVLIEPGRVGETWFDSGIDGPGALLRVDLDTGEFEELARWESAVDALASDGDRLFASVDEIGVVALSLDGEEQWTYPWPTRALGDPFRPNWANCQAGLVVFEDALTLGCELGHFARDTRTTLPGDCPSGCWTGETFTLIARLDAATGEEVWKWTTDATTDAEHATQTELPDLGVGFSPAFPRATPFGLSVASGTVIFLTLDWWGTSLAGRNTLVALDEDTGALRWAFQTSPRSSQSPASESFHASLGRPLVTDTLVFVILDGMVQARNLGTGMVVWEDEITGRDLRSVGANLRDMGISDGALYVPSDQFLRRYDLEGDEGVLEWVGHLDTSLGEFFNEGPLVAGDRVYLGSWNGGGPGNANSSTAPVNDVAFPPTGPNATVWAFDKADGSLLWSHPQPGADLRDLALSDGLLVYTTLGRGTLVALGRSEASPDAIVSSTSNYPAIGEIVRVDFSASAPGAFGPVTQYRAIWGDGSESAWQTDPVLTHAYNETGEMTARFVVGNEANQTASVIQAFHVGGSPQRDPAWFGDTRSLGLLAIVVVLGVGAAGLVHVRRRHVEPADRLELYRVALAGTLASGADPGPSPALAALRGRLGITDKEHARLVEQIEAEDAGATLRPGGRFLGRYQVQARLGAGATGEVWRARDEQLDRTVAIKRLTGELRRSAQALQRFRDETRMAARLHHPHVVTVHDVETVGGETYLIMEHLPGGSLADRLDAGGPLAESEAVPVALGVLSALCALHSEGILHRDVKPSNVLFATDGTAKLSDFTVARRAVSGETLSGPGASEVVGTLSYMAPEQARGVPASQASDLYAVGATLYEALAGRPPVDVAGLSSFQARERIVTVPPGLPLAGGSKRVNGVLERALAKDPEGRYRGAKEMARALDGT